MIKRNEPYHSELSKLIDAFKFIANERGSRKFITPYGANPHREREARRAKVEAEAYKVARERERALFEAKQRIAGKPLPVANGQTGWQPVAPKEAPPVFFGGQRVTDPAQLDQGGAKPVAYINGHRAPTAQSGNDEK